MKQDFIIITFLILCTLYFCVNSYKPKEKKQGFLTYTASGHISDTFGENQFNVLSKENKELETLIKTTNARPCTTKLRGYENNAFQTYIPSDKGYNIDSYSTPTIVMDPSIDLSIPNSYEPILKPTSLNNIYRPFNDIGQEVSYNTEPKISNVQFDNSYYDLWNIENTQQDKVIMKRVEEIEKSGKDCHKYKDLNQCMSICSKTNDCYGFSIKDKETCCLLRQPEYKFKRYNYSDVPVNDEYLAYEKFNASRIPVKNTFFYYSSKDQNDSYGSNFDDKQCKNICPKCIYGQCPPDYKCVNLQSDPKNQVKCVITNNNQYDEKANRTFDSNKIKPLDAKFSNDMTASYALTNPKMDNKSFISNKIMEKNRQVN